MRTNIEIDDKLLHKARRLSHVNTKKQVVHLALSNLVKTLSRKKMLGYFGKIKWEGKLSDMRS
jgi:Arc/MetJ family transcription regulator